MNKFKIEYQDFDEGRDAVETDIKIKDTVIKTLNICYDGGRLYVSLNGEDIYENLGFGSDASLSITKIEE